MPGRLPLDSIGGNGFDGINGKIGGMSSSRARAMSQARLPLASRP
jgi:hypothetical protein